VHNLIARAASERAAGTAFTYVTVKADPLELTGIYRPVLTQEGKASKTIGPAFAVQPAD